MENLFLKINNSKISFLLFLFLTLYLKVIGQMYTQATFDAKTIDVNLATGSIGASSNVGNGAAGYSIPLVLPPGTNGIVPEISVNYSSMGGSSPFGFGWGMSGLSIITRVGQTNYYDNQIKPLALNTDDRFAIDGNRMIGMLGTYGADNSTYATESENFNEIKSFGNINGSPEYFIQTTKDGIKMEYGRTVDSRKICSGKVLFWKLNKIEYPDGNYIEYNYLDQELVDGVNYDQHRINEIKYTGNAIAGIVPYNTIKFNYINKAFKNTQFECGCGVNDFVHVNEVAIFAENERSKLYQFYYASQNNNTYLKEIRERGTSNINASILNTTIFKYGTTSTNIPTSESTSLNFYNTSHVNANLDGDGKSDIILVNNADQQNKTSFQYLGNTKSGGFNRFAGVGDFNGDGRDEIVVYTENNNLYLTNLKIYKLSSLNNQITDSIVYNFSYTWGDFSIADFNGDGLADIFIHWFTNWGWSSILGNPGTPIYSYNIGSPVTHSPFYDWSKMIPINFNGDSKTDILILGDNSHGYRIFNITNKDLVKIYESTEFNQSNLVYPGDFNGDGKSDILKRGSLTDHNSAWSLCYGTGNGYNCNSYTWESWGRPTINNYFGNGLYIADFNADGRSDIILARSGYTPNTAFDIRFSGTQTAQSHFIQLLYYNRGRESIYDINGDGRADFIQYKMDGSEGPRHVYLGKDSKETLLESIKNGEGHITSFEYKKMTEKIDQSDDFYIRGDLSTDVVSNVQFPAWLVKTYKSQNGIGGYKIQTYKYENAKVHKNGKGILGFGKIVNEDADSYLRTISEYTFDNSGNTSLSKGTMLPLKITTEFVTGTPKFTETNFTFQIQNLTGVRYHQKALTTEVINHYEGRKTSTINRKYDDYGNVKNYSVKQYHKLSNGSYELIDTTNTLLGYAAFVTAIPNKVTFDTTITYRKGESTYSKINKYEYTNYGQLEWKREFFGQPKQLNTYYSYHNHGSHKGTKLEATGMTDRYSEKSYDTKGRFVTSETDPIGNIVSATYDPKWGRPLTTTGIDGLVTTMTYDEFGRLKTTLSPTGYIVTETYQWDINAADKTIKYHLTSHPGKPNTKIWYDVLGRVVKTEKEGFASSVITQKTLYDQLGNIFSETAPKLASETDLITSYTYESNYTTKRVKTVTTNVSAFGTTTYNYTYDQGLLSVKTISPASQENTKTTDVTGKIVSAQDHGGTLNYTYYSHGGIKNVKNGTTTQVSVVYDIYGRKEQMIDINAGTTSYVHDAFGQLTSQTNAKNQIHIYTYDNLGRVHTKVMPEGTTTNEYYLSGTGAKNGKLKKVTGFAGDITEYDYDNFGRLIQEKVTFGGTAYTTDFLYNIYGDLTRTTYPTGLVINRYYDSNGFPTTVKNNNDAITLFTNNEMSGRNQIKKYTLGNTKQSTTTYFHGIPTGYVASGVQNLQMKWNYASMNLMSRRDYIKNRIDTFGYDNLNRLTWYKMGSLSTNPITWGNDNAATYYDNGNFNNKFDAGTYSYNSSKINAVETVTNPSGIIPDIEQNISYNSMFQPVQMNEGPMGYNRLDFTYGADENRIKSELKYGSGPGASIVYTRLHLGDYEINTQGGSTRHLHYISAGDGLVAIVQKIGTAYTYYYTYTDHQGSILTLTSSTGAVVTEQNFDPWGRRRNPSTWAYANVTPPNYLIRGYTGHEHIDVFGLINMNGRLYDPVLGRMLNPDNFVQDGLFTQNYNRYSYAYNNPLRYTDPDGEFIVPMLIGAGISVITNGITNVNNGDGFFKGAGKAAFFGAFSGALSFGIGSVATATYGTGLSVSKALFQASLHGFSGAIMSKAQGGTFGSGFLSGALSSGFSSVGEALNLGTVAMIGVGGVSGGVGSMIGGGNFMDGFKQGLITSGLNHAMEHIQGEISESRAKRVMKEYYALVAGESSDNYDEARAIGEVILKRAEKKGVELKPGWTSKLGKFDAIGRTEYTEIMEMDFAKIVSLQPKDNYYLRIKGADDAFWNPSADYSNGAWFFNATFQKYQKNKGFNFNTYESGKFVITAELGKTTFFKYAQSGKKWP